MVLFRRKPKQPTPQQLTDMQQDSDIETQGVIGDGDSVLGAKNIPDDVDFTYQVVQDEGIARMFEELDWLDELRPYFSRLNFLSNFTPDEAQQFKMAVNQAITYLKYRRKRDDEKMLLLGLRDHFGMRINDSVHGWKLNQLTTQKKVLQMMRFREKKGALAR